MGDYSFETKLNAVAQAFYNDNKTDSEYELKSPDEQAEELRAHPDFIIKTFDEDPEYYVKVLTGEIK